MTDYKLVKVADIFPYVNNSRTHTDEQVNLIAQSITEFGFLNPVLIDSDGSLIAGHARTAAAKQLGLDEVPALVIDHLSEQQKKAYVIADNQLALNSGSAWDLDILKSEVENLIEMDFDTDLLGFDTDFLGALLNPEEIPNTLDEQQEEPEPKYISCPHCGKEFDSKGGA